jgi:hypothetical protein
MQAARAHDICRHRPSDIRPGAWCLKKREVDAVTRCVTISAPDDYASLIDRISIPPFLLRADDHCPVNSMTILRVCNANPLRAVQQQVGAMSSGIDPLL